MAIATKEADKVSNELGYNLPNKIYEFFKNTLKVPVPPAQTNKANPKGIDSNKEVTIVGKMKEITPFWETIFFY